MVYACADPDFFVKDGGRSKPNGEKTAFFMFVLGFFSPKFSVMRGGPTIYGGGGGGGVQMLISIEFDRTCDLPGMGVRTIGARRVFRLIPDTFRSKKKYFLPNRILFFDRYVSQINLKTRRAPMVRTPYPPPTQDPHMHDI